jgi:hypothetical protein
LRPQQREFAGPIKALHGRRAATLPYPGNNRLEAPVPGGSTHIERARQQTADFNRDAVAVDHHRATSNRQVVGKDLDGVVFGGFELDYRAATEPEHLMDRHESGTQYNGDID